MDKSLKQKSAFGLSTFTIDDTGLLIEKRSHGNQSEFHLPFEQIMTNKERIDDGNRALLAFGGISAVIAIIIFITSLSDKTVEPLVSLLFVAISIALFTAFFLTKSSKLYLSTSQGRPIEFGLNKSNQLAVTDFVNSLIIDRNDYLSSKYGNLTRNIEYGPQLDNLNWLLKNKAISKTHYDEKIAELNRLFSGYTNSKPIGFSKD